MSWLITLIVGALIGWISGLVGTTRRMGMYTNILTGILGSIAGVWFFVFLLGLGTTNTSIGSFQPISLVWEAIGAIVTLIVMNAVRIGESPEAREEISEGRRRAYGPGVAHEYREKHEYRDRDEDDRYR